MFDVIYLLNIKRNLLILIIFTAKFSKYAHEFTYLD